MTTLLVIAVSLTAACEGKPTPAEPAAATTACTEDSDCTAPLVCLGGSCTKTNSGAIYTDPSNAVTPDKMKRQLEHQGAAHQADVDQAVDRAGAE